MEAASRLTLDKKRIAEVAAVVFHLPNSREMGDALRYPGQRWIGWSLECKQNYRIQANPRIMKHFDFMMTYETRSDVWCPYLPKADWWRDAGARATPAKSEEAPVALFVSARLNYSGRLDLVEELSKHLRIDSYGRYWHNRNLPGPDLGKVTKLETIGRYRFCLAVENSIEQDYVTEKMRPHRHRADLGAPNVDDFVSPVLAQMEGRGSGLDYRSSYLDENRRACLRQMQSGYLLPGDTSKPWSSCEAHFSIARRDDHGVRGDRLHEHFLLCAVAGRPCADHGGARGCRKTDPRSFDAGRIAGQVDVGERHTTVRDG